MGRFGKLSRSLKILHIFLDTYMYMYLDVKLKQNVIFVNQTFSQKADKEKH